MKKMTQLASAVALASGMIIAAPSVMAEVSASAAVASTYLWRGYDLGSGTPAVSGDITVSEGGAYGGIWGSSGDSLAGTEYDLYAGYGMEMGGVTVDLSVWNYVYPTGGETDFFEFSEVILTVGAGPISFSYYDNVAGGSGYEYYSLSGEMGSFSATLGMHDYSDDGGDPVHLDISYAYNDNLAFTLSQFIVDQDEPNALREDGDGNDDLKFVVSYSLPIDM